MNKNLKRKLKNIQILALDFDGTLTDGHVYVDQDGHEQVKCSRRDSMGINVLQENGIYVVVISREKNKVVSVRCSKMAVDCYQGITSGEGKLEILERYVKDKKLSLKKVAYMGDDINDLDCLKAASIGITVADGHKSCKNISSYVTKRKGGGHAVREVCELILEAKSIKSRL